MPEKTSYKELEERVRELEQEKDDAVRVLAGGIAHGFNNLLMGIQGSVSLLSMNSMLDSGTRQHLDRIEFCVNEISRLTSQLVGFARCGKYESKPLWLNQMIDTVAGQLHLEDDHCRMVKNFQDNLWTIEGDSAQIELVVDCLLSNAMQALTNSVSIYLSTQNRMINGNSNGFRFEGTKPFVELIVRDTGVGMDAKTLKKIFDPFFTTRNIGVGKGLGLSSVLGIVTNHYGYIHVESEVGKGSTFTVLLPAFFSSW